MELAQRLFDVLKSSRGVEGVGSALKIPAEVDVELYINTGTSFTTLSKVTEISVDRGLWSIRNIKGEVSYFPEDRIAGLRVTDSTEKIKKEGERGTGFTRGL